MMENADVGIVTFNCADYYGAMLQAYGLKSYLQKKKIRADIVPYEPPFMTGRHWWIPYIPLKNVRTCLGLGWEGWICNLHMGKDFFRRRNNMRVFRKKYLLHTGQKKLFFSIQLKKLPYRYYILGSDQIWNPNITCGLRRVYFGAFESRNKEKVFSYAASLGGRSLPDEYGEDFLELVRKVDVVSVREKEAIPYVEKMHGGKVAAVPDPVLLLSKGDWQRIEKTPDKEGYILMYTTEKNERLTNYVKRLSDEKRLPVIELRSGTGKSDDDFLVDYTAGPGEFLGYIHKAGYIVTNSFHAIVFSIIFQKQFLAFLHSSFGIRIENILKIHGLENRIYGNEKGVKIDTDIEWIRVEERTEENVKFAEAFLMDLFEAGGHT